MQVGNLLGQPPPQLTMSNMGPPPGSSAMFGQSQLNPGPPQIFPQTITAAVAPVQSGPMIPSTGGAMGGSAVQRPGSIGGSLAPGGPIGGSGTTPGNGNGQEGMPGAMFLAPRRPSHGVEGRPIVLRANHFQVRIPGGIIQHYEISITPDKCPRRVNR